MEQGQDHQVVLYVAKVASHIRAFHLPFIEMLVDSGHVVDVACSVDVPLTGPFQVWDLPFSRRLLDSGNLRAYQEIRQLAQERNYQLVHTHTPVASFICRYAFRDTGIPVVYTCHGFHYFKGAPLLHNLIYRFAERLASRWTSALIVMNNEDYESGVRLGFIPGNTLFRTHGVGLDLRRYRKVPPERVQALNAELGIPADAPVALCVAELTANKNHEFLLNAWRLVSTEIPQAKLLLAGEGDLAARLREVVKSYGLDGSVVFLGYHTDIPALMTRASVVTLVSFREGLPRSVMEAMAIGRPAVVSDIRGNRDLVEDAKNGRIIKLGDVVGLAQSLLYLLECREVGDKMGYSGMQMISAYSLDDVKREITEVYEAVGLRIAFGKNRT